MHLMKSISRPVGLCLIGLAGAFNAGAATFADSTFNLSDYLVTNYTQGGSVAISQVSTGNPGPALREVITVPSPAAVDRTASYLFNTSFTVDPSTLAPESSFTFSLDKSVSFNPSNVSWINGQGFMVLQAGRLYEVDAALSAIQNVFQTATVTATSLQSFNWLSDPAQRVVDTTVHPSLIGGPLTFGFYIGIGVPPGFPSQQVTYLVDNFSVNVSAVPEPSTAALWMAALAVIVVSASKSAGRRAARH